MHSVMEKEEEEDEEEEEIIVYANFEEATVEKEVFQLPNVKLKIIGLDSDTPIVQLRDSTFKGEWKGTVGTKLLLEEDPNPEQVDPTFTVTPETMLKYKCQSVKTLDLSRIFLKPKSNSKNEESKETFDDSALNHENDATPNESIDTVVQSVIHPSSETDSLMKEIVNDTLNGNS